MGDAGLLLRKCSPEAPPLSRQLALSQPSLGEGICPRKGEILVQTPEKEEVEGEERERALGTVLLRFACSTLSAQVVWFYEEEGPWILKGHSPAPSHTADTSKVGIPAARDFHSSPSHLPKRQEGGARLPGFCSKSPLTTLAMWIRSQGEEKAMGVSVLTPPRLS